jgi:hypothetical protein
MKYQPAPGHYVSWRHIGQPIVKVQERQGDVLGLLVAFEGDDHLYLIHPSELVPKG